MSWSTTPTRFILTEVDERGLRESEDGELLSVSEHRGVVPRRESASQQAASEDVSHYKRCEPGQLVLNKLWAFRGGLGVSPYTGLVSPAYAVYDINPRMDPKFVHYQTRSAWFVAEMTKRLRGIGSPDASVGRAPHLNTSELGSIEMYTPPLDTQRRIADMLDTGTARINALIEKNDQVAGLLAARAARVLEDEVFSASAPPVGIHYLATYVNGFPFRPEDRSDDGTPIVRIAQLLGDTRQQDFYAGTPGTYCHIESGDLIFSWSATLAAKVWEGGPAFLNQHLYKVEPHNHVNRDWLLHALNAAVPRMKAMTHGSTMTHITRPMMTQVRVPSPSLPEQQAIAERIAVQFAKLDALRTRIDYQQELLRLRREALITAAVTGQIEV